MKLAYRGTNYDYDIPAVDMIEGEVAGKYRGQNWSYRYPRHIRGPQQAYDVNYRRTDYSTKQVPKADEDVAARVDIATAIAIAAVTSAQNREEIAKVHRVNICNILDRRKQVAAAKGDESLLRLLEKEWKQMAC
jgi:Domain of unknown function (DUF4278)